MPYLPNELWLLILPHLPHHDLWLSLRTADQQLRDCVEQYFETNVLPTMTVNLPIALPTYDIRQRLQGRAIFVFVNVSKERGGGDRASYSLRETDPCQYQPHFQSRWESMKEAEAGRLPGGVRWEVRLGEKTMLGARLKDAIAVTRGSAEDDAQLSFEWKAMLTTFFRESG